MHRAEAVARRVVARLRGVQDLELLRAGGLRAGRGLRRGRAAYFDGAFLDLISVGDDVSLGRGVLVLSHDASTKRHLDVVRIGAVQLDNGVRVGDRAIILPGVHLGAGVRVLPGSVVTRSAPAGTVLAGNPARPVDDPRHRQPVAEAAGPG